MLQTSSLLVLTATEAHPQYGHPQYGDIIYYSPSNRSPPPAPISGGPAILPEVNAITTNHYAVHPPADSAVDVGSKNMKAAEEYQVFVEALALAG